MTRYLVRTDACNHRVCFVFVLGFVLGFVLFTYRNNTSYKRINRFGFMSDSLSKKHGSVGFAYFSRARQYFHLFIEPTRDPRRILSAGQLLPLPMSLCAFRLGRCFFPLLLQIVQQLLGRLLPIPLRIILCPPPQILAGLLEGSLSLPG